VTQGKEGFFVRRNKTNRKIAVFGSLRVMVMCSVFVAISIVCGKYLAIRGGEVLRFSFENLPIILSGMAFGPLAGAAVGVVADLVGCLLVGYTVNPIVTLGGAMIGLLSGSAFYLLKKAPVWLSVSVSVALSHFVGSVVIKTFGLAKFYTLPIIELALWRLLNYVIVGVIEGILIYALLKNKGFRRQLEINTEAEKNDCKGSN
jgi:ECF transporter S component (folate family)